MAEQVRKYLRLMIVPCFVMAVFFFLLIFMLGLAQKYALDNKIDASVPLRQSENATWGEIPGNLSYSWQRSYKLYEFAETPSVATEADIKLSTVGTYEYDIERSFGSPNWYAQKSVANYTQAMTYGETAEQTEALKTETMKTINMGAYDVWTQMSTKPRYFVAWQAMVQAYELMIQSDFINRLYAYNGLEYFFNDYDSVRQFVLPGFTDEAAQTIYDDPNYGMNSITGLTKWMTATSTSMEPTVVPSQTKAAKEIIAYFSKIGVDITQPQMSIAIDKGSMASQIFVNVQYSILNDNSLDQHGDYVLAENLVAPQWGNSGVTNNPNVFLQGVEPFISIKSLDQQLSYPPELSDYVLEPSRANLTSASTFSTDLSNALFTRDLSLPSSMLNTDSMRTFFLAYANKEVTLMTNRFGFDSWAQVEIFYDYVNDLMKYFLLQNSSYDIIALSQLQDKNLNSTLTYLQKQLPLNVCSRVVSSLISQSATDDCASFFVAVGFTTEEAATTCTGVDLTNPNDSKGFLNATWYGGNYMTDFQSAYGLTDDQVTQFFDTSGTGNFGAIYAQAMADISTQYGCNDAVNCTAEELAGLQWGSLEVTSNPSSSWGDYYFPKQQSTQMWGQADWLPFGAQDYIAEYPQWTSTDETQWTTIDKDAAVKMQSNDVTLGGLGSFASWQYFLIPYYTQDASKIASYQSAWGSTFDIDAFVNVQRTRIESVYFGGAFADILVSDMLNGYENDVAARINGGDYFAGDDFALMNYTNPIRIDVTGPDSVVIYGLLTGENGLSEIGQIRTINEQAFTNKQVQIYNGTDLKWVPQQSVTESLDSQDLSKVSYGMQWPPGIQEDDQLRAYDYNNMKVMTFTHDHSDTMGDNKLAIETYIGTSYGDNVEFAFDLPLYAMSYGCYDCSLNPDELRTIEVDGKQYNISTTPSDNYIKVQPDSGYLYQMKKESTVYMIVGGTQDFDPSAPKMTPFPSLDPIYGAAWPLYDFSENLVSNETIFTDKFAYIATGNQQMRSALIGMSVMAALTLIMGIVAITVYKIKDPKRRSSSEEEVLVRKQDLD